MLYLFYLLCIISGFMCVTSTNSFVSYIVFSIIFLCVSFIYILMSNTFLGILFLLMYLRAILVLFLYVIFMSDLYNQVHGKNYVYININILILLISLISLIYFYLNKKMKTEQLRLKLQVVESFKETIKAIQMVAASELKYYLDNTLLFSRVPISSPFTPTFSLRRSSAVTYNLRFYGRKSGAGFVSRKMLFLETTKLKDFFKKSFPRFVISKSTVFERVPGSKITYDSYPLSVFFSRHDSIVREIGIVLKSGERLRRLVEYIQKGSECQTADMCAVCLEYRNGVYFVIPDGGTLLSAEVCSYTGERIKEINTYSIDHSSHIPRIIYSPVYFDEVSYCSRTEKLKFRSGVNLSVYLCILGPLCNYNLEKIHAFFRNRGQWFLRNSRTYPHPLHGDLFFISPHREPVSNHSIFIDKDVKGGLDLVNNAKTHGYTMGDLAGSKAPFLIASLFALRYSRPEEWVSNVEDSYLNSFLWFRKWFKWNDQYLYLSPLAISVLRHEKGITWIVGIMVYTLLLVLWIVILQ